jgi:hypothetical protein
MIKKLTNLLYVDPSDVSIFWADPTKLRVMVKCKGDATAWFLPWEERHIIAKIISDYIEHHDTR